MDEVNKIFDEDGYVSCRGKPYKIVVTDAIHKTVTLDFGGPLGTTLKVSEIDEVDYSDLELVMRHSDGLGEFLNECARMILEDYSLVATINRLSDEELLELINWWKERNKSQKYTTQVGPGPATYLNVHWDPIDICVGNMSETGYWRGVFNRQEIKELKKRDDIAIDWDKTKIEPVEDDE